MTSTPTNNFRSLIGEFGKGKRLDDCFQVFIDSTILDRCLKNFFTTLVTIPIIYSTFTICCAIVCYKFDRTTLRCWETFITNRKFFVRKLTRKRHSTMMRIKSFIKSLESCSMFDNSLRSNRFTIGATGSLDKKTNQRGSNRFSMNFSRCSIFAFSYVLPNHMLLQISETLPRFEKISFSFRSKILVLSFLGKRKAFELVAIRFRWSYNITSMKSIKSFFKFEIFRWSK